MQFHREVIELKSNERFEFTDITSKVKEIVRKSNIKEGFVNVYTKHTTSCIRINENETRLLDDFKYFLEEIAPSSKSYRHDDIDKRDCPPDEPPNGHAHCKTLLMAASETIPITNAEVELGQWQTIFHIDLDGINRTRSIIVKVVGV